MKVIKANKISMERIIVHKTDEIFLCKNFTIERLDDDHPLSYLEFYYKLVSYHINS